MSETAVDDVMQLAIKGKDGSVVHLTIAKQARLQTLMEEYCKSQEVVEEEARELWRRNSLGWWTSNQDERGQKKHEIRFINSGRAANARRRCHRGAPRYTRFKHQLHTSLFSANFMVYITRTVTHARTPLHTNGLWCCRWQHSNY